MSAEQRPAISVMLIVPEARAAIAWYKNALGASELWNLGGVAGLQIDGAPFFLHEVNPANPTRRVLVKQGLRAPGSSCSWRIRTASSNARLVLEP